MAYCDLLIRTRNAKQAAEVYYREREKQQHIPLLIIISLVNNSYKILLLVLGGLFQDLKSSEYYNS